VDIVPRPKVLVFQHVPFEPLGTLDPLLKEHGFRIRYVNFSRDPGLRPRLAGYDALIVLGGPMNADETEAYPNLATELELIRAALDRGLHVLGICLGAQLLAKALGGTVRPNGAHEIGWHEVRLTADGQDDPVLSALRTPAPLFHWHGDRFELPPGGTLLAASDLCANQAFRCGELALGLQFHLEVDAPLIERWLTVPVNRRLIERLAGEVDPATVRRQTSALIGDLEAQSRQVFGRWIDQFETPPRRRALPSR
jgi:GMP synthase (glutamine-hydrolysing)